MTSDPLKAFLMPRYRLAIFDFDGTLANSLDWFRTSFHEVIARFDLTPVTAEELEQMRGLSAREIMARLNVSMWQLPAIVSDMRKRKLAAASETSLFAGIPAMLSDLQRQGIKTAIVSSDSEASVRQVLGPATSLITCFDCGAAIFGKHWKFRRVARKLGSEASGYDLHRRRDPRYRSRESRRHGFRRGGLGLRTSDRAAGGGTDASVQFDRGDDAAAHYDDIMRRGMSAG